MASKLSLALVFVCLLQVCLSARIPRDATTTKKEASSEELTMEDVNKMQRELSALMPPKNAERFANVMRKFTKDASSAENMEGVMQLFTMALAANSNKTEQEWQKIFEDSDEEENKKTTD